MPPATTVVTAGAAFTGAVISPAGIIPVAADAGPASVAIVARVATVAPSPVNTTAIRRQYLLSFMIFPLSV